MMQPIYTEENTRFAYQLNWSLSLFWRDKAICEDRWLPSLQRSTERDDIRILKHTLSRPNVSQFLVSTKPFVPPEKLVWSVKGRLQHEIQTERPKAFRRNYAYRSVGTSTRQKLEDYIQQQLGHHRMADPAVQARLKNYQRAYPKTDLSKYRQSAHGRYWYNLHLTLVNDWREKELRDDILRLWGDTIEKAAKKHGHYLSRVGVLPEHIHISMSCPQKESPGDVALSYMNNLSYVSGIRNPLKYSFYVGTIGEYNLGVIG